MGCGSDEAREEICRLRLKAVVEAGTAAACQVAELNAIGSARSVRVRVAGSG